MADVIRKATNRFTKGLVMDFSPENTKNEVLTHALNASLVTFNGNELSLQNDMGNARVETAYLPEGYIPVGTCEYGGIIYIVSYNPLEDKSQIGCFPSPERNISNKELGKSDSSISKSAFQEYKNGELTGKLNNTTQYVLLKDDNLNPGDKFLVCANADLCNERLADLWVKSGGNDFNLISNPMIALNIVSIEDSGKIVYLNSDIRKYDIEADGATYKYHILGTMAEGYDQTSVDPDSYRNTMSSGYSVFKSKTSGKLAILAELLTIDSYSVTHSIVPSKNDDEESEDGKFDVIIYTEVLPEITESNKNIVPKLRYYYLRDSQGYLQATDSDGNSKTISLFNDSGSTQNFLGTPLNRIYTPTTDSIKEELKDTLQNTGEFQFPSAKTYHGPSQQITNPDSSSSSITMYTTFTKNYYHRVSKAQVTSNQTYFYNQGAKFYAFNEEAQRYPVENGHNLTDGYQYWIYKENYTYVNAQRSTLYENEDLYAETSTPTVIDDPTIFYNPDIKKFIPRTFEYYREASQSEIQSGSDLYKYVNGQYISYNAIEDQNVTPVYKKITGNYYEERDVSNKEYTPYTYYYYSNNNKGYKLATKDEREDYYDFAKYRLSDSEPNYGAPKALYYLKKEPTHILATESDLENFDSTNPDGWYYVPQYTEIYQWTQAPDSVFLKPTHNNITVDSTVFQPNASFNYIEGNQVPGNLRPNEKAIKVTALGTFKPGNLDTDDNYLDYSPVKLASIKLPDVVSDNGLDLPFKYDYTLVPCMSYGRLDHLAVSNTVDFSKLHAFNQSTFNTWKYHIDDNQLRLTFGAEIFDTYETNKVDGLVLEFYDLWGFAGSLEITDKKSYSGIFTKIIPLNTLNALSKKKISENEYKNSFKRNINILKSEQGFTLNEIPIYYNGEVEGWSYSQSEVDFENDCGTLYSNILYGVKAYIRRTPDSKNDPDIKEFIPKGEFFLYTLPIYNDYYYTVNDFNTLVNPQLDFTLTYKLQDSSTKTVYSTDDSITGGYVEADSEIISQYVGGTYGGSSLNATKYYKYKGTSDLYLEIGLKQEYQNVNISYSPDINQYYSCDIYLTSDTNKDKTFDIKYTSDDVSDEKQALNYFSDDLDVSINKLGFDDFIQEKEVSGYNFRQSNFINKEGTPTPISINYEFIVGYKIDITNIRNTEVPATTICALLHQNELGDYNYSDFGIYTRGEGENIKYLSEHVFYNGGSGYKEIFGLCRQKDTKDTIDDLESIAVVETDARDRTQPGNMNAIDPLKQLVPKLGKYAFCQPHAHMLDKNFGINVVCNNQYNRTLVIAPDTGTLYFQNNKDRGNSSDKKEVARGTHPYRDMWKYPRFSLSLNTINMIDRYGEFISTLDYETSKATITHYAPDLDGDDEISEENWTGRMFTGFTSSQVQNNFNKQLMETMKYVYAYNPDYDSLKVNAGDVSISDRKVKFTSNLINKKSELNFSEGKTLNDFIYLGPICFTDYITYMNQYSGITITKGEENGQVILPQIQLVAGFDNCGTENYPMLLTSLTYNTPAPEELEDELAFKSSNTLVVNHHDNKKVFLKGIPNKKALYGYSSKYNKLVQLDVTNYEILTGGKLNITDDIIEDNAEVIFNDSPTITRSSNSYQLTWTKSVELGDETDEVTFIVKIIPSATCLGYYGDYVFVSGGKKVNVKLSLSAMSSKGNTYKLNTKDITIKYDSASLKNITMPALQDLSGQDINHLLHGRSISINNSSSTNYTESYNTNETQRVYGKSFSVKISKGNLCVYGIKIHHMTIGVEKVSSLELSPNDVVHVNRTKKYSEIKDHKYIILDNYKQAVIKGTSLTLNDLRYFPNVDGHRLYVKDDCTQYDPDPRSVIYYREMNDTDNHAAAVKSWVYDNFKNKNCLYLLTGPCFVY